MQMQPLQAPVTTVPLGLCRGGNQRDSPGDREVGLDKPSADLLQSEQGHGPGHFLPGTTVTSGFRLAPGSPSTDLLPWARPAHDTL